MIYYLRNFLIWSLSKIENNTKTNNIFNISNLCNVPWCMMKQMLMKQIFLLLKTSKSDVNKISLLTLGDNYDNV